MPHRPKPFFRNGRGWFVQLGKQQIKLADGPKNTETENAAWERFHAVMTERKDALPQAAEQPAGLTIIEVLDKYLDWCKKHRAGRTYEWYHDHIQSFIDHAGQLVTQPVADLKPFHVVEWADSHPNWSNAYRRGAIIAIQRPFNFGEELGYIEHSPIKRIRKPQPQRREQFVTPEQWETIKNHYTDGDPFRDLLEVAWETGARPQEAKFIEARHVDLEHHRVTFPPAEAKGGKRWRIIRTTPRAEEIIKRHLEAHPQGVIFRNEDDAPWTAQSMSCRFARLQKHLGVKYCAYALRHGFCQDLLEQGNDATVVAELMGHADSRQVSQTYSHMNKADSHLQRVLMSRNRNVQGNSR